MKNDPSSENIRIIFKKKAPRGEHHGGAWKVAYADFVTAMMALFLVLWIIGASAQVKGAVSLYFSNPDFFKGGAGILSGSSKAPPSKEMLPLPDIFQNTYMVRAQMDKLQEEGKKIEDIIASQPDLKVFKDKVKITVTEEGMKIELIENSEGLFFNVGSSEVKSEAMVLLKYIASVISKLHNQIIIEGHTDARPYDGEGYSNWELSSDRANAARRLLEDNGVPDTQITEIRGLADKFLKHKDKPFDFSNRRVNILLLIPKIDPKQMTPEGPSSLEPQAAAQVPLQAKSNQQDLPIRRVSR
ncbi:MAG: OmpA family protein [Proteobacteria bacterium]|nr:OmpA family protein [Pseudomonadota bacterium]MBU4470812.1 OmpA family protein [Pseudomonadota bacterium]MCG2751460.1 OmpA family protein [Desulfobacteraceae bacterium]